MICVDASKVFLGRLDRCSRTLGLGKVAYWIVAHQLTLWIAAFHQLISFVPSKRTPELSRYRPRLLLGLPASGEENGKAVAGQFLRQWTGSIEGVENVMVEEPGRPPMSLLALVVENVMVEVAVYRPLNRWVEGEAGGTVEE
jgi:hypothetical protein